MASNNIYDQFPLHGHAFRLLFICPAAAKNRRLQCYCLPFQLDDAPSFEALSYVWGNQDARVEIICNGQVLTVGQELANALSRLRRVDSTRIIWVDALCIDQGNREERNHQVPLMRTIYSKASRVLVWLGGDESLRTKEAAACVALIGNACRASSSTGRERNLGLHLSISIFSPSICKSLIDLYNNSFFTRVWCVQEVKLAQGATVLWGSHELDWDDVGLTASWILDRDILADRGDIVASSLRDAEVQKADAMHDGKITKHEDFLVVLQSFRRWEATDPRDKVYGLISFAGPSSGASQIYVDYDKTTGEVFADTVLVSIRVSSSLIALAYVTHPEEYITLGDIPSWAPNWSKPPVAQALGERIDQCPWRAGGNYAAKGVCANIDSTMQLSLTGIFFDAVNTVQTPIHHWNTEQLRYHPDDSREMHPFAAAWHAAGAPNLTGWNNDMHTEDQWGTLMRTLSAGCYNETEYIATLDESSTATYIANFIRWMSTLIGDTARSEMMPDEKLDDTTRSLQEDAYHFCWGRRMFWTANGTYGLGPQCMRPGDIVVVLYGGNTPYVLRPCTDKYLFMGQAYIDCLMRGELVERLELGEVFEQDFCLI